MEIKRELLNHFKSLREAIVGVRGEAYLNVVTFKVEIRIENTVHVLYPHFVVQRPDGGTAYATSFSPQVQRFAGWRPYERIRPFSFGKKLAFKALLKQHGFNTPVYSSNADCGLRNVIIKRDISSFGSDIRGPFETAASYVVSEGLGEFYEEFVPGQIVKIWFWNESPTRIESRHMPEIIGNGESTVAQLLSSMPTKGGNPFKIEKSGEFVRFQGKTFESVLEKDERVLADYRYTSSLCLPKDIDDSDIDACPAERAEQLQGLGRLLYDTLRREGYANLLYTVDAILDHQGQFWFLEANPNPFVHPALYVPMVKSLAMTGHSKIPQPALANA